MRSFWLTGWLLLALLACSAVDPRAAMADAPAAPASSRGKPASPPARPDPDELQFRTAFTLCGYVRAQKIEELSAGWSTRKQLLVQAVELANLTTHHLDRAAASVLHDGLAFYSAGRAIAGIHALFRPSVAESSYCLLPLHRWPLADWTCAVAPILGISISVAWLARRHATPASADDGASAARRLVAAW